MEQSVLQLELVLPTTTVVEPYANNAQIAVLTAQTLLSVTSVRLDTISRRVELNRLVSQTVEIVTEMSMRHVMMEMQMQETDVV